MVTLHVPLTADTHHLLNRRRIEQMRHGAFVVNTARGSLLDTEALLAALESGRSAAQHWTFVEGEEGVFYSDHREGPIENQLLLRLQQLPNVLITPHTAYYTDHALSDIVENTLAQLPSLRRTSGMGRLKLAIVFGGCSEEHAVSVKSAQEVATHLDLEKYEPCYIGITKDGAWNLCDDPHADWETGNCRPAMLSPDRSVHGLLVLEQGRYETIRDGRRVSGPAWQTRRGRGDAGLAGTFRHPLRRLRCPKLCSVHGQIPGVHGREERWDRNADVLDRQGR